MSSNYDNSAWFYDRLSRLVYGKTLIKAQTALLHLIPERSRILIAGGGTGLLLEELGKLYASGSDITYVELSAKMMARAKKRPVGVNHVTYINAPVEDAGLQPCFDVVITPFLLDSLSPQTFDKVFSRLDELLSPTGLWLNIDFRLTGKWWQKLLLKSMYLFFRIIGCVETMILPGVEQAFLTAGYHLMEERSFFGGFIAAGGYRK